MLEAIRMEELINDAMRANPSNVYGSPLSRGHYDYYRLWDVLESHGFKKLGHGNFSCVFEHRKLPNKVVKITFHEDFGYETWAKACMGENNPYLPKIHYMNKTKLFGIYILDKLVPLDGVTFWEVKEKIYNGLRASSKCGDDIDQVVDILNWVKRRWDTNIDLHSENMMQTVDGQVVVTDPICVRKPSSNRLDRVRGELRHQPSFIARDMRRIRDMNIPRIVDTELKKMQELLMHKPMKMKFIMKEVLDEVIVPKYIDLKAQARSRMRDFNQRHFREMMFKKPSLPKFRA